MIVLCLHSLLMQMCNASFWSLSYTVAFWQDSYCPAAKDCAAGSTVSACSLVVPAFNSLASNLQEVLLATGCTFTRGDGMTTRQEMCTCFNIDAARIRNSVAFVLNVFLGAESAVRAPVNPAGPSDACLSPTYKPAAATYVCTKPGSTSPCECPKAAVGSWNATATSSCRAFLARSADGGRCLPAIAAGHDLAATCQVQSCPCTSVQVARLMASPSSSTPRKRSRWRGRSLRGIPGVFGG